MLLGLVEGSLDPESIESVDAHLDSCVVCREVVTSLAGAERAQLHRGDEIGRFVVLEQVGEGAMGVVYAAFDPQLDRRVALKLLTAESARERVLREARSMARLSHPNVVTVFDVGEVDADVWIAMELVDGATLREWMTQDHSVETTLATFREAGRGLAAAHREGLVHRDFKPDNVLFDERAKVTDFGLARAERVPDANVEVQDVSVTRTGALLGTPAYMAPEQLQGETADARSDQFAFCVALWEALHGERPFEGRDVEALLESIQSGPRKPVRSVPRRVHAALLRGLSVDPSQRFADLDALLAALEPPRSRRMALLAGVALVGLVGVGVAASPEQTRPCEASRSVLDDVWNPQAADRVRAAFALSAPGFGPVIANAAIGEIDAWAGTWTEQRVQACEATHVRHEQSEALMDRRMVCLDRARDALAALKNAFARADASLVTGALEAVESLPDVDACSNTDRLSRELVPEPALAARVREGFARLEAVALRISAAKHREALDELNALALVDFPPLQSRAHRERARALLGLGRYEDAERRAYEALWAAEAVSADLDAAESWLLLAQIAGERGQYDAAGHLARHARASVERAGNPAGMLARLENVLGVLATKRAELGEAETHLARAQQLREQEFGADHPAVARVLTNLGNRARLAEALDDALALHRRALEIDREALGEEHPLVGRHLHNIAGVLRLQGKLDEARETYLQALSVKREGLGNHPETARTLNSLGLVAVAQDDSAEARARYEEALGIFIAAQHADEGLVRLNLALLSISEERFADAVEHLERAEAIDTERFGEQSSSVAHIRLTRASAFAGLGRAEEAYASMQSGAAIARELGDAELIAKAENLETLIDEPVRPRRGSAQPGMQPTRMAGMAPSQMAPSMVESAPEMRPAQISPAQMSPAQMSPAVMMRRIGGSTPVYGADRSWN